jgi:hypothetical protein
MTLDLATPWLGTALDGLVIALLAGVLWRLRRDPEKVWREREAKLVAIVGDLRLLVAQGESQARDLDERLAERAEQVERLLRSAQAARPAAAPSERATHESEASHGPRRAAPAATRSPVSETEAPAGASLLERVRALAESGAAAGEIARRLEIPLAEARMLASLVAARRPETAEPRPGRGAWTEDA